MIFVKGYGQMCNNILQYAHIYAWGRENGINTVSMRFAYKYRYFALCNQLRHNWLVYVSAKLLIKTHLIKHLWLEYPEEVTPADVDLLKHDRLIALSGWGFRFPDLFFKYEQEIRQLFTIKAQFRRPVDRYLAQQPPADIRLAVHIRRGDYTRFLGGIYYFTDEVYLRRIKEFIRLFPDKKVAVYICTNDPGLNIGYYRSNLPDVNVQLPQGSRISDLYLISQCNYIIGPKSSFSLVAAFYHDLPLFNDLGRETALTKDSFCHFKDLFMAV